MPWGVAAASAASLAGSALQANAVGSAGKAGQGAARLQREDLTQFRDVGGEASRQAGNLLGLYGQPAADAAMATYQQSPGYQWQLGEGLRAVDAGAAAKGMLRSGATLKAEQAYGSGLAAQDFSSYYNRLFGLATQGQAAAAGTVSNTNALIGQANSGGAQEASIYGNAAKGVGTAANDLFSNPNFQSWLKGSDSTSSYDPTQWGYTAGGAGQGTLESTGFFTPLR